MSGASGEATRKIGTMRKILAITVLIIAASLLAPRASATAPINFATTLTGAEEVPPVATTATGSFVATLDSSHSMITFTLTASGFPDPTKITASHIHVGDFGVNGPVVLFLFNRITEGTFPGTKTGILTSANYLFKPQAPTFADAIARMRNGTAYVNMHTEANPGGEIRGQLEVAVEIDIKPGSDPNSINPRNNGNIPVAILSDHTLDAPSQVDTSSLTFGRTGHEQSLLFCNASPEDVNGDGRLDLVCHFDTRTAGFMSGDTVGVLRGLLTDGSVIEGRSSVRILSGGGGSAAAL